MSNEFLYPPLLKIKILNNSDKMSKLDDLTLLNDGETKVVFAEYHFFPFKK